jgi:hypothetical protein
MDEIKRQTVEVAALKLNLLCFYLHQRALREIHPNVCTLPGQMLPTSVCGWLWI